MGPNRMTNKLCLDPLASAGRLDAELFMHSSDCILVVGVGGNVVRLNPGARVALELDVADQLEGACWVALWPADARDVAQSSFAAALSGRRSRFSAFCPTFKGAERWWDVAINPIYAADASVCQLLIVARDMSRTVLAEKALSEANRRKEEFLALVSHELRNPLSALVSGSETLINTRPPPETVDRIAGMIWRQARHLSRLTEDLLDISRAARHQINLKTEKMDFRDAIEDAIQQLGSGVAQKRQVLALRVLCDRAPVLADRTRLTQIVANILGNASRYSPAASAVEILLYAADGWAVLEIRDSGKGIEARFIPKLFDLYAQAERGPDARDGGLGLGLPIVKRLVELHDGEVGVQSEGPGHGSVFTVRLPLFVCEKGDSDETVRA